MWSCHLFELGPRGESVHRRMVLGKAYETIWRIMSIIRVLWANQEHAMSSLANRPTLAHLPPHSQLVYRFSLVHSYYSDDHYGFWHDSISPERNLRVEEVWRSSQRWCVLHCARSPRTDLWRCLFSFTCNERRRCTSRCPSRSGQRYCYVFNKSRILEVYVYFITRFVRADRSCPMAEMLQGTDDGHLCSGWA